MKTVPNIINLLGQSIICYSLLISLSWPKSCFAVNDHILVNPQKERILGDKMMQDLRLKVGIVYCPSIEEYINHIGMRLARESKPSRNHEKFFLVNNPSFNAFAFFAGHVAINTGVFQAVESESELAAIIAHELAHVQQQHLARKLLHHRQLLPITIAEMVAAVLVTSIAAPELMPQTAAAVMAANMQGALNFSRQHEQEADNIGIAILQQAGFDPEAMPDLHQKLGSGSKFHSIGPEYLQTHPLSDTRVAEARNRAGKYAYQQRGESLKFALIKARLDVLTNPNVIESQAKYELALKRGRYHNIVATKYGLALANSKTKPQKAVAMFTALVNDYPNEEIIFLGLIDTLTRNKQLDLALAKLQAYPNQDSTAFCLQYGKTLISSGNLAAANIWLEKAASKSPANLQILTMLAANYGRLDKFFEAHLVQAKIKSLFGDFKGAKQHIYIARSMQSNASSIARLDAIDKEITLKVNEQRSFGNFF